MPVWGGNKVSWIVLWGDRGRGGGEDVDEVWHSARRLKHTAVDKHTAHTDTGTTSTGRGQCVLTRAGGHAD